ncbi:hypothetical protein [Cupriavidus nantongensis]|nr:hypothetical protein [Cupriavidus nantongensis]
MPRAKNYAIAAGTSRPDPAIEKSRFTRKSALLDLSEILGAEARLIGTKTIDYRSWLGRGIDDWVWTCVDGVLSMLASGSRQASTVRFVGQSMRYFFSYLCDGRSKPLVSRASELTPIHVAQYAQWLQLQGKTEGWSKHTARGYFAASKQMLWHLIHQGVIHAPEIDRFFPKAPIPTANGETRTKPLSNGEQQRLADALKADLIDLRHGGFALNPSEIATVRYLVIAMRSGGNPTPLLEMRRDALMPGLVPGVMGLRTYKYRGHQVHVRATRATPESISLPMDAVGLLRQAIADSKDLAAQAPDHLKDRVWLYRSALPADQFEIKCLAYATLVANIRKLVTRRMIVADDGSPLKVTISRLRASLAKRAWRLSDGDPIAVAGVLGNTTRVADTNYLGIDEQLQADAATFIERELGELLRGGTPKQVVPISQDTASGAHSVTPTGRCADSLHGARAPKDGTNHCDLFVMCLFCPSFAITGELADLWRLFSYQAFIISELDYFDAAYGQGSSGDAQLDHVRDLHRRAANFIDELSQRSFGQNIVAAAKEKALREPHPFWAYQTERLKLRRAAIHLHTAGGAND